MYLVVNGVDLSPYIESGGLAWQKNDVDGSNAGRTMDSNMHRDRIGEKVKLVINTRPLSRKDLNIVLRATQPEYVTCTYNDPLWGRRTAQFYSNNQQAKLIVADVGDDDEEGYELWDGITFPLIEV